MKKKHIIILSCVTLVILAFSAVSLKIGNNPVANAVGTVLSPVQKWVSRAYNSTGDFIGNMADSGENARENKKLKEENLKLQDQLRMLEGYKAENDELRRLIELAESRTDFKSTAANVIGKNLSDSGSVITIDKGTKDGIGKNAAVLVPEGLVGVVFEAGYNYSKVRTIFDSESSVSSICLRSGDMGIVEPVGYLSADEKCSMNYIDRSAKTVVGDIIETSGTGGIYPRGIKIGKITEIKEDSRSLTLSAVLETDVKIKNLDKVLVSLN